VSKQPIDRKTYLAALCRNVPYHITEAVLEDPIPEAIGDQEFEGSILYADLVGFTALCDELARAGTDALSRLSELLSTFFGGMLEEGIFPFDGYVVQFGGDSVTVAFRGPGHAVRAAACALETCRIAENIPQARRSDSLRLRVGVASGQVALIVIGDRTQRSVVCGTKVGTRALSIQERAEPGTVFVDEAAAARLEGSAALEPRGNGAYRVVRLTASVERNEIRSLEGRIDDQIEERIALLEPFVPPPLAARLKMIPEGWNLDGELRDVVIAFSEVRGFDAGLISEAKGVSERFLRLYRRYGGVVMKADLASSGYRVLVVFGLHAPTDMDSERALVAALDANAALQNIARSAGIKLTMQTGLHRGEVYFGAIGSPYRYDLTIVGDAVNVAARAAAAADPCEVVITRDALDDLRSEFGTTPLGPIHVKGKQEPLELFAVHGALGIRARYVQTRRRQRAIPGREQEVRALEEIADAAMDGVGGFVGIVGEAGAGKSFLLSPLVDRWTGLGGIGLIARSHYATRALPLAPVVSMFRSFVGLLGDESVENAERQVREQLAAYALGEDGEPLIQFLCRANARLSDAAAPKAPTGDDHEPGEQVLSAIARFVEERMRQEPVMYIIEDLHNADSMTIRLARRLTRLARRERFVLLATYRPDERLDSLREQLDRELELPNLGLRKSAELLTLQMGAETVDDAVIAFLWERTRGNPGQLVELIRFLRDRGLLRKSGGRVTTPPPGVTLLEESVPKNVAQFALARIESLGEVERRLLRIASTIGRTFDRMLIEPAAKPGLDADGVEYGLTRLLDEGVITPAIARRPAYRFREDVTRAVTYSTIPRAERRGYHGRIADAMEQLSSEEQDRNAVALAHHRERAGQLEEAARWYRRAIDIAGAGALDEEARFLIERWEDAVLRLPPERRPDATTRAEMALRRFVLAARYAGPAEALELAEGLIVEHGQVMKTDGQAHFAFWYGASLVAAGRTEEGRGHLERAYESGESTDLRADAALRLARSYHGGDAEAERLWLDRCAAEIDDPHGALAERLELARACRLAAQGDLDQARVINAQIRESARRHDRLRIAATATNNLADCDLQSGDVEDALKGFVEARVMARALGTRTDDAIDFLNQGLCHLYLGRPDQARPYLDRALGVARSVQHRAIETEAMVHLGAALALTDDPVEGRALCEQGRQRAAEEGLQTVELAALLHLLHIALIAAQPSVVQAYLAECEERIARLPVPLLAKTYDTLRARAR
jgi:class 3 adenylate cyclase/tetratricopeptide (TPR) repeat protein